MRYIACEGNPFYYAEEWLNAQGGNVPFFVTAKKRSEQALIQIIQEAWINGVSTRKIEWLAKMHGH